MDGGGLTWPPCGYNAWMIVVLHRFASTSKQLGAVRLRTEASAPLTTFGVCVVASGQRIENIRH